MKIHNPHSDQSHSMYATGYPHLPLLQILAEEQRERSRSQEKPRIISKTEKMNEYIDNEWGMKQIDLPSTESNPQLKDKDINCERIKYMLIDEKLGNCTNDIKIGNEVISNKIFLDYPPLSAKIRNLSHTKLPFPIGSNEIERIFPLGNNRYILSSATEFIFYDEKDHENFRAYPNSDIGGKALSFNQYKDIGIWLVERPRDKIRVLVFQELGDNGLPIKKLRPKSEPLDHVIIDDNSMFCMTPTQILVFDLELCYSWAKNPMLINTGFDPTLKIDNKGSTDMCVKGKCLYMAGNHSNKLFRVNLEKAYTCLTGNLNDAITNGILINKPNPKLESITNVQIIPVDGGVLVSTSYKTYLIDDNMNVIDACCTMVAKQVTKFEQGGREFLAILHNSKYLTLMSIFKGRLCKVSDFTTIEKRDTQFYGLFYCESDNYLMVYGRHNYQNWFAIDFSQVDLAHYYANN